MRVSKYGADNLTNIYSVLFIYYLFSLVKWKDESRVILPLKFKLVFYSLEDGVKCDDCLDDVEDFGVWTALAA